MVAFGAGTVPLLAAIGLTASTAIIRPWLGRLAPAVFALNAAFLLAASIQVSGVLKL